MLIPLLFQAYRFATLRNRVINLMCHLEGGPCYSPSLRRIFRAYHEIDIGLYTHGGCFVPGAIDRYTSIGRYGSIAHGVRTINHNHPLDFKSTHAFFFNPVFKRCAEMKVECTRLTIGHDVWIGANALILPNTQNIGHGAIIGAGAVVNRDVPPYAVVLGNPARLVRFRFPQDVIDELLASRWWEKSIEELDISEFTRPHLKDGNVVVPFSSHETQ